MNPTIISQGILNALKKIALIAILIFVIYKLQSILIYIAISAVLSLLGRPIVLFLRDKLKLKNILATLITILFFLLVFFGIFSLFIPIISQQGKNLSLLDVQSLERTFNIIIEKTTIYFDLSKNQWQEKFINSDFIKKINFSTIPNLLNGILNTLGNFTMGVFSVLFITFFLLKDSKILEQSFFAIINVEKEKRWKKSLQKIKNLLSRYFIGLLLQVIILFIIYSTILLIFDIQNALIIAFLCALFNLIPYLGPVIGGILMLILSMTSHLEADFNTIILPKTIYVMLGFIFGQLIDNLLSQPIIFSNSIKSHPLEIFIIILIAGILFGAFGLLIAVPFYTALKVIFKEFFAENKIIQSLTKNF